MPLPPWVADVATTITDVKNLVLLEGSIRGEQVLILARLSTLEIEERMELKLVALILDADMMKEVDIDPEETTVYSLEALVDDRDSVVAAAPHPT